MRLFAPIVRMALVAGCAAAPLAQGSGDGATISAALAGRGDRFIELDTRAGTRRFVNVSAGKVISYEPGAIVMRTREAGAPALRYELAGAPSVPPRGAEASGITYNFLIGPASHWVVGARSYSRITYAQPWAGIDATYVGDAAGIKYHFDVAPRAEANSIRFIVTGAREARVAADGAVEWRVGASTLRDEAPLAWQATERGDTMVRSAFTLERLGEDRWALGFELGNYDRERTLIVDPAWTAFSGLVGGNAADQVYGVARDASGGLLACGSTASSNVPTVAAFDASSNGGDDAFLVKFNAAGTPQFVTYLGGSGFDVCTGIAVHPADSSITLVGGTTSTNFPFAGAGDANFRRAKTTADRDAFIARLPAAGNSLTYSGVVGGLGDEQAQGVALDASGRPHVVGYTRSSGFPIVGAGLQTSVAGGMDGFALRVSAAGSALEYSGLIGGNGDGDVARAVAVNASGVAYVVGETNSNSGLPSQAGTFRTALPPYTAGTDGFIARITAAGALDRFTILTGSNALVLSAVDRALGVALDNDGSVVVAGETDSAAFPSNDSGAQVGILIAGLGANLGGNMDGFVVRLASDFSSVIHRGYVGGTRFDTAEAVAADGVGNVFFAGTTSNTFAAGGGSNGFATIATPGLRTQNLGLQDGFFGRLTGGTAAFLGYAGTSTHDALHAVASGADSVAILGGATSAATGASTAALGASAASPNGIVFRVNPIGSTLSDVNGDGRSDILYRNNTTGQVWRLFANGLTLSGGAMVYTEPNTQWRVVGDGDFNGDGISDLLWRNTSSGQVYVMPFNASGLPSTGAVVYTEPNPAWRIVHTPDLDGDGKADLLWWNATTGQVFAALLNGTTVTAQAMVYTEPNTQWRIAAVGDLAGSGKKNQLVWRNATTGQVYLMTVTYAGGGFTQTGAVIYNEPNTAWTILGAPDLNGDGKSDLLYRNSATGQVYGLIMNGGTVTASAPLHVEPDTAWKVVSYGDYNGDGRADLLWRHDTTGQLYMMLVGPTGLAIQSQGVVYNEPNTAWRVLGPWEYAQ